MKKLYYFHTATIPLLLSTLFLKAVGGVSHTQALIQESSYALRLQQCSCFINKHQNAISFAVIIGLASGYGLRRYLTKKNLPPTPPKAPIQRQQQSQANRPVTNDSKPPRESSQTTTATAGPTLATPQSLPTEHAQALPPTYYVRSFSNPIGHLYARSLIRDTSSTEQITPSEELWPKSSSNALPCSLSNSDIEKIWLKRYQKEHDFACQQGWHDLAQMIPYDTNIRQALRSSLRSFKACPHTSPQRPSSSTIYDVLPDVRSRL